MADDIITEIPIAPLKNIDTDEQFYPITHVDAVEGLEGYGGTVTEINKLEGIIMTSTDGTVSLDSIETEGNIGIETTHIDNSVGKLGGIRPGKYFNAADAVWNDTNAIATHGITESSDTDITISSATSTAGRFYPLQVDKNGVGFVNVPWVEGEGGQTSDFTLRLATNSTIWLQKDLSDYSSITIPTFSGTSIGLAPFDDTIASADRGNYHLTAAGTWVLPVDSKVSQTLSSTNAEYPILLSTVSTSGDSDGAYYSTTTINASTGAMTVTNGNNRTIFNSGSDDNPVTVQSRDDALSNWSTVSNRIITTSGLVPAPTSGYYLRYTTADGFNWASVSGTDLNTTYKLTLNNTINGDGVNGIDLGTLYAPSTSGSQYDILISSGTNAAPVWYTSSANGFLKKTTNGWAIDTNTYSTTDTQFYININEYPSPSQTGTCLGDVYTVRSKAEKQYDLINANGSKLPEWCDLDLSSDGYLAFKSGKGWLLKNIDAVTSVGLSMPSIFNVSGFPVTSSGTLTASLASQIKHTVFAAPYASNGTPNFRSLSFDDLEETYDWSVDARGYLYRNGQQWYQLTEPLFTTFNRYYAQSGAYSIEDITYTQGFPESDSIPLRISTENGIISKYLTLTHNNETEIFGIQLEATTYTNTSGKSVFSGSAASESQFYGIPVLYDSNSNVYNNPQGNPIAQHQKLLYINAFDLAAAIAGNNDLKNAFKTALGIS